MAAADRTTLDGALKDIFLGPLQSLINNNLIQEQIVSGSENVQGRKAIFGLHTGRSVGLGAITDGGALPAAGSQKYKQGATGLATLTGVVEISKKAVRTMSGGSGAYVSEPADEMENMVLDVKRDFTRQIFGTGDGVIAATGVTSASNTVNIANGDLATTGFLQDDARIDIGTVANPTAVASGRLITAVNTNAAGVVTSIVISGAAVTTATTDRIFRAGNGGTQTEGGLTFGKEINGLRNIVSATGELHTINPSTTPRWKSYEVNVGGGLTDNVLMTAGQRVYREAGASPSLVITTDGVYRNYGNTLTSMKRTVNSTELKGGFTGLAVGVGGASDMVLTWDRDVPGGHAFGLQPSAMKFHTTGDWDWDDSDGAIVKWVQGYDAVTAYLVRDIQLATRNRQAHFKLTGLTES